MITTVEDQQQIVMGLKALDNETIERLVEIYSRPLFGVIIKFAKNPSDAEEVLQDTFLRIVQKIDSFREESKLWPWMRRIAINNAIMWLRKHRARLERSVQLDEKGSQRVGSGEKVSPVVGRSLGPEETCLNSELSNQVYDAILRLPYEYRLPLILKDIEGVSLREIAALLGIKQSTTKTRIHRARLKIREKLTEQRGYGSGWSPIAKRRLVLNQIGKENEETNRRH